MRSLAEELREPMPAAEAPEHAALMAHVVVSPAQVAEQTGLPCMREVLMLAPLAKPEQVSAPSVERAFPQEAAPVLSMAARVQREPFPVRAFR
jgi:hypothetical protein